MSALDPHPFNAGNPAPTSQQDLIRTPHQSTGPVCPALGTSGPAVSPVTHASRKASVSLQLFKEASRANPAVVGSNPQTQSGPATVLPGLHHSKPSKTTHHNPPHLTQLQHLVYPPSSSQTDVDHRQPSRPKPRRSLTSLIGSSPCERDPYILHSAARTSRLNSPPDLSSISIPTQPLPIHLANLCSSPDPPHLCPSSSSNVTLDQDTSNPEFTDNHHASGSLSDLFPSNHRTRHPSDFSVPSKTSYPEGSELLSSIAIDDLQSVIGHRAARPLSLSAQLRRMPHPATHPERPISSPVQPSVLSDESSPYPDLVLALHSNLSASPVDQRRTWYQPAEVESALTVSLLACCTFH